MELGLDSNFVASNNISCYKFEIPLVYQKAESGTKEVAVIRAPRTGNIDHQPLLYLHGGPGVATIENAQKYLSARDFKRLREHHDIIMMDYSGTGYSGPYLCEDIWESIAALDLTNSDESTRLSQTIKYYQDCRDSLSVKGIDAEAFSSFQIAADAESVRTQLGISDWNIYSVSYGTMVALLYMRHFPSSLKSVVLDSPFPPNAKSFNFVKTLDETMNHLQAIIDQNPVTARQFPSIIDDFASIAARLNVHPLNIDGTPFTGNDFAETMLYTFYKSKVVPLIPLALHEFAKGNDDLLVEWVNSLHSDDEYGTLNEFHTQMIYCYECKPRRYEDTPAALSNAYPHLSSISGIDYIQICNAFRPESPDSDHYNPIKTDIPVLVLVGEFDPGTPKSYGEATIKEMSNATLIVVPNASHAAMHFNECTSNIVYTFLEGPNTPTNLNCIEEIQHIIFPTKNLADEMSKLKK
ncbi:MAG: alpha/beta fold hydrolase [Flavobacteriales bacterium]